MDRVRAGRGPASGYLRTDDTGTGIGYDDPMIDKTVENLHEAVSVIEDGAVVLISGFGESGNPTELAHALIDHGARDLTLVNNNAGNGHVGMAALLESGQVRKIILSALDPFRSLRHHVSRRPYRA